MLDIIFVYLVNPVKEVMAELLPIFIAPIKILFEIFIRYIEVEGWYVVIMFPFIMAFYFWLAYKIFFDEIQDNIKNLHILHEFAKVHCADISNDESNGFLEGEQYDYWFRFIFRKGDYNMYMHVLKKG